MSKTLLSRLAMFELLDEVGPLTISELARRCGIDVSVVSRNVAACVPDGWLVRVDGRVALGPRCTLLGHRGPVAAAIQQAEILVPAVAGITGLLTQAVGLVGRDAVMLAAATVPHSAPPTTGLSSKSALPATAAGRAIASQLDEATLERVLPDEPYPDFPFKLEELAVAATSPRPPDPDPSRPSLPRATAPRTRAELDGQLEIIRRDGVALDPGIVHPAIHCVAAPWRQTTLPAAIACLGSPELMSAKEPLVRRILTAVTADGANIREVALAAAELLDADQP